MEAAPTTFSNISSYGLEFRPAVNLILTESTVKMNHYVQDHVVRKVVVRTDTQRTDRITRATKVDCKV